MSKSIKAALLSALVFPGAGHFYLRKQIIGAVLVTASFAALYLIVTNMIESALQVVEKIERGEISLDLAAISEAVTRQASNNESQLLDTALTVFIGSWIIAIVHSYICGRAQDRVDYHDK